MNKKNLVVTMSGGTTTVINSTLAGLVAGAQNSSQIGSIFAGVPGILGVLQEDLLELSGLNLEDLNRLKGTPGSGVVGTTRVRALNEKEKARMVDVFRAHNVGYFVNIGGNGTLQQTKSLVDFLFSELGVRCASAPKTVDNDLGDQEFRKMAFTPGFPSCVNYWCRKINLMNLENLGGYSHDQVLIAQTFGRETGLIAGSVRLADPTRELPLIILLPEDPRPIQDVVFAIQQRLNQKGRCLVVLSEGYDLGDIGAVHDHSGQVMYGTSSTTAAQLLVNALLSSGIQARYLNPTIDQRLESWATLPDDRELAYEVGRMICSYFDEGKSSFLASIQKVGELKFQPALIPFDQTEFFSRKMKKQWVKYGDFDVTDEYVSYLKEVTFGMDATGASHFVCPQKFTKKALVDF